MFIGKSWQTLIRRRSATARAVGEELGEMSERGARSYESIGLALERWYGETPFKLAEAKLAYLAMVDRMGEPSSVYTPKSESYVAVTWPSPGQQRDPSGTPARMELQYFTTLIAARVQLPGWLLSSKAPAPGQNGLWYCWYFPDFVDSTRRSNGAPTHTHCPNGCDPYGPPVPVGSKCPECEELVFARPAE
jgi:hypothetical protein